MNKAYVNYEQFSKFCSTIYAFKKSKNVISYNKRKAS